MRFHFPDGVVSLPFYHPSLAEIDDFKQKKGQKINKYFLGREREFAQDGKKALKNHPTLNFYHYILTSTPKKFNITQKTDFTQKNVLFKGNTEVIILEGGWLLKWIIITTQNLKVIF